MTQHQTDIATHLQELNARWDEAFNTQQPTVVASFYDDEATALSSFN